jgi:hypothetical protein
MIDCVEVGHQPGVLSMRVAAAIELSDKERARLQHYVSSRTTPVRLVERSRIVLFADEGYDNQAIARASG